MKKFFIIIAIIAFVAGVFCWSCGFNAENHLYLGYGSLLMTIMGLILGVFMIKAKHPWMAVLVFLFTSFTCVSMCVELM